MKYSEKLQNRYFEQLTEALGNVDLEKETVLTFDDCGSVVRQFFLGSVLMLLPSGKIYAPWTTNQTVKDVIRDRAYMEALESMADSVGYCVTEFSGDLFLTQFLGEEYYITEDGVNFVYCDGSSRINETLKGYNAVCANMEKEGFYPEIYYSPHNDGELQYYNPSEWSHIEYK